MPDQPDTPATKSDIRRLDERGDAIQSDIRRLDGKIDNTQADVRRLATEIVRSNAARDKMEERLSALIREESAKNAGRIDAFLSRLETYDRESATLPKAIDEHGKTLRDHERRLGALESQRA